MDGTKTYKIAWSKGNLLKKWPNHTKPVSFKVSQQADWFLLMHNLLNVGFSMQHAVQFSQRAWPKLAMLFTQIDRQLARGTYLANTLKPYLQKDLYYQILLAEQHGNLATTLNEVGQYLTIQKQQRRQLKSLLEYPLLLLMLMGIIFGALLIFVFPELKTWQAQNQTTTLSTWPILKSLVTLLGSLGLYSFFLWWQWRKKPILNRVTCQCHWPIFGAAFRQYYSYYITANLALLLKHGFSLKEICQTTEAFDHDSLLYQLGQQIQQLGSQGEQLTAYILKAPYLPDELAVFINRGLNSEQLGAELAVFAQLKFNLLKQSTTHLLVLVQPILFILIGGGIIGMYLSILMPIYHSLQSVY